MSGDLVLSAAPVTIRHIKRGSGGVALLNSTFVAQPKKGVNGRAGYQSGTYTPSINEDGEGTLVFLNDVGDDGVLHRRRFAVVDPAQNGYHLGDEWIEVWQLGRVLWVGTILDGTKSRTDINLDLVDGRRVLQGERETAAGFWCHAPRDVFEHYTKAWRAQVASEFLTLTGWQNQNASLNTNGGVHLVAPTTFSRGYVQAQSGTYGTIDVGSHRAWRLEMTYDRSLIDSAAGVTLGLASTPASGGFPGNNVITIILQTGGCNFSVILPGGGTRGRGFGGPNLAVKLGASLAIECRDRCLYFYVDGDLVVCTEWNVTAATNVFPFANIEAASVGGATIDVHSLILRRADPYLMPGSDKGTYRIPGSLPSGGLQAAYYDDTDLVFTGGYTERLIPTRTPYAVQEDQTVSHAVAVPTWQPPKTPNGENFSVIWSGAIFLDLANSDVTLRVTALDDAARLWVGKTRYGEWLINQWPAATTPNTTVASASMRTFLGTSESGWYPLVLHYANGTGNGGIRLQQSIGGGAYADVPASVLSPFGIYQQQVRYDSHGAQLDALTETFGYQSRLEPRSLESGLFPGELVPRIRVGRDTNKILTPDESTDVTVKCSAEDTVDTILADAAGLSDPDNSSQITSESIDYQSAWDASAANRHPFILSDYISLADITDPGLLRTRLDSMLALRTDTWEEVAARPRGHAQIVDTFPITGSLALFDWEPGDGVRLVDDQLDLSDDTPRQIISPSWPFNPDGRGAPTARFRERPRTQQRAMRDLFRAVLAPQRNYQGQLAVVSGSHSNWDAPFSRVSLPDDLSTVKKCTLVIGFKSDSSSWTINDFPANVTIANFAAAGRVDLLPHLKRRLDGFGSSGQAFLVQCTGGTGTAEFQLELTVQI